jgi:hypothetical protein
MTRTLRYARGGVIRRKRAGASGAGWLDGPVEVLRFAQDDSSFFCGLYNVCSSACGLSPEVEGFWGNCWAGRLLLGLIEGGERFEEGLGFGVEAELAQGFQDAGDAEMVVVAGGEPVGGAGWEGFGGVDCRWRGFGEFQAIEFEHAQEGAAQVGLEFGAVAKLLDGGVVEKRGVGVEGTSFAEGKEPLDVVVDLFEVVVGPILDGGEGAASMVLAGSLIEIQEVGVRHGVSVVVVLGLLPPLAEIVILQEPRLSSWGSLFLVFDLM